MKIGGIDIDKVITSNVYDNAYLGLNGTDPKDWTDWDEAKSLMADIVDDCKQYEKIRAKDGVKFAVCYHNDYKGCRWSKIYLLNGVTKLIIAFNCILSIIGIWSFPIRALASCCGTLICCLTTAAIITTGVFRFNTWGKLAALNLGSTKYSGGNFNITDTAIEIPVDDSRTYSSDGEMILITWIFMMVLCLASCFNLGFASRPPVA